MRKIYMLSVLGTKVVDGIAHMKHMPIITFAPSKQAAIDYATKDAEEEMLGYTIDVAATEICGELLETFLLALADVCMDAFIEADSNNSPPPRPPAKPLGDF